MSFDARTEKNLATLDPKAQVIFRPFITRAKEIAASKGCEWIVISGNRTWAEQDALYAQGRTKPGKKVTNAKGGQSNHNFKIAIDGGVFKNGVYLDGGNSAQQRLASEVHRSIAAEASRFNIDAGALWTSFKDEPHFEIKTCLNMAKKRELFSSKGSVL